MCHEKLSLPVVCEVHFYILFLHFSWGTEYKDPSFSFLFVDIQLYVLIKPYVFCITIYLSDVKYCMTENFLQWNDSNLDILVGLLVLVFANYLKDYIFQSLLSSVFTHKIWGILYSALRAERTCDLHTNTVPECMLSRYWQMIEAALAAFTTQHVTHCNRLFTHFAIKLTLHCDDHFAYLHSNKQSQQNAAPVFFLESYQHPPVCDIQRDILLPRWK